MKALKIVYAGTPEFSRVAYMAIIDAGFQVPMVLTQPDRPAGRGMKLQASAVKQEALTQGAEILQPQSLRLDGKYADQAAVAQAALRDLAPDVMVVAAYGLILPQWVLELPKYGCLNIHASLLPRWRGAAPIQRAIEAGDTQTGVAIMQMDVGLDTGAVLLEKSMAISDQNSAQLHDQLAQLGSQAIVEVLTNLGDLTAKPQSAEGITYAAKIEKTEAALDLRQDALSLWRKIRAFNPAPGANLRLAGFNDPVKVWSATVLNEDQSSAPAGTLLSVTAEGIDIATGRGVLRLLELQKAGGKRQGVETFVLGMKT